MVGRMSDLTRAGARCGFMAIAVTGQARAQREQPEQRASSLCAKKPLGVTAGMSNSLMARSWLQQQPQQLHR